MFEIIPGILEKEWVEIERKIERVRQYTKTIHIDLIDGIFAPNTTFLDPQPFKKYTKDIFFELHMMVNDPIRYVKPFGEAGFKRFLGHIEKMPNQAAFIAEAELIGEVGLAIDGKTSLDAITIPYEDLDTMLIMTINAGFSGQKFEEKYLEKVKKIHEKIQWAEDGKQFPIAVDGGITDQTIQLAKNAGAIRFISTSYLFKEMGDDKRQYQSLCGAVTNAS